MKDKSIGIPSLKELSIIIISAFILTLVMSYLDAYERLHLFTSMYHLFTFDEFIVFMPYFLAMGFILLSYHKIQQLEFEITKREEVEEALRKSEKGYKDLSITDGLTQLFNSRHFYSQLEMEIDRTSRYNHPLSLLLMDIDNF
jgi:predicted signal transduction protein with EAL and GGDEF domain